MQIRIRKDANVRYCQRNTKHGGTYNKHWDTILELVSGEVLEVETKCLFNNQFNTAPISEDTFVDFLFKYQDKREEITEYHDKLLMEAKKSLCETGLRIMEEDVDEVIDDIRPLYEKCDYCGEHRLKDPNNTPCPNCIAKGYEKEKAGGHGFKPLDSLHTKRYFETNAKTSGQGVGIG